MNKQYLIGQWAITQTAFESLKAYTKVLTTRGKNLDTIVNDGIGYIHLYGDIFPRENFFTYFDVGTDLQSFNSDLIALEKDPSVRSVVMLVDSFGGSANGIADTVSIIRNYKKPITAYAQNALSGGYWIGSAAPTFIASPLALLGSIGVIISVFKPDPETEIIDFVSAQSPFKKTDLDTELGKNEIQTIVDQMADIFISAVAEHRNVKTQYVLDNFGQGRALLARVALQNKMIDGIMPLPMLQKNIVTKEKSTMTILAGKDPVVSATDKPDINASNANIETAVSAELNRIKSIEALGEQFKDTHPEVFAQIKSKIDAVKFDRTQTAETVSLQLLTIISKVHTELCAKEKADRSEVNEIAKNIKSSKDANADLGDLLIRARKERLNEYNS